MREITWFYPIIDRENPDFLRHAEEHSLQIPEYLYDEEKVHDFNYYVDILGRGNPPQNPNETNNEDESHNDSNGNGDNPPHDEDTEEGGPYGFEHETLLELALSLRLQPILHRGFQTNHTDREGNFRELVYELSPEDLEQVKKHSDDHDLVWRYILYQKELMKTAEALEYEQYIQWLDRIDEEDIPENREADSIREFIKAYESLWNQTVKSKRHHPRGDDGFPQYDDPTITPDTQEGDSVVDELFNQESFRTLFKDPKYSETMDKLRKLLIDCRLGSLAKKTPPYEAYEELIKSIDVNFATRLILYRCIAHAFGYTRNMRVFYMALDYDGQHQGHSEDGYFISEDERYLHIVDSLIEETRYHVAPYLAGPSVKLHFDNSRYTPATPANLGGTGTTSSASKQPTLDYKKSMDAMRKFVNTIDQTAGNLIRYKEPTNPKKMGKHKGCFGILEYEAPGAAVKHVGYYSFSGIFDTNVSALLSNTALYTDYERTTKKQMDDFISKVINPSPELGSFTHAICTADMLSYRSSAAGPVPYTLGSALSLIGTSPKWSDGDIKPNFSCCERKMLPLMEKDASAGGCGYIYTKFNTCDICQVAVDEAKSKGYDLETPSLYTLSGKPKMQAD